MYLETTTASGAGQERSGIFLWAISRHRRLKSLRDEKFTMDPDSMKPVPGYEIQSQQVCDRGERKQSVLHKAFGQVLGELVHPLSLDPAVGGVLSAFARERKTRTDHIDFQHYDGGQVIYM